MILLYIVDMFQSIVQAKKNIDTGTITVGSESFIIWQQSNLIAVNTLQLF